MYCGNCGKEIKEGSAFCPACGAKVVIVKTGRENSKKKNRKKFFIPVLLIIIIAIIGIKNVSNIKPVVEKFLTKNNVQKDDMDDDEQAGMIPLMKRQELQILLKKKWKKQKYRTKQ